MSLYFPAVNYLLATYPTDDIIFKAYMNIMTCNRLPVRTWWNMQSPSGRKIYALGFFNDKYRLKRTIFKMKKTFNLTQRSNSLTKDQVGLLQQLLGHALSLSILQWGNATPGSRPLFRATKQACTTFMFVG